MLAAFVGILVVSLFPCDTSAALWGSYTETDVAFTDMNAWISASNASLRLVNIGWDKPTTLNDTFSRLVYAPWSEGAIPIITWMPYPYATWTNPSPNVDIANGLYDQYIDTFAALLLTFLQGPDGKVGTADDRRAYMRFAPAMNGDWFPWSPTCSGCASTGQHINQTTDSYITMYKYVMNRTGVLALPKTVIQMVFAVNNEDAWDGFWKAEDFWVGQGLADWIDVDGFNWGTTIPNHNWTSPQGVYGTMLGRLQALPGTKGLPVALQSVACTTTPNGVSGKNSWISDVFQYVNASKGSIGMVVYYNVDSSSDWSIFGGKNGDSQYVSPAGAAYNVYTMWKTNVVSGVASGAIIGSNAANQRLVSDVAFATGHN
eukprot:PhF_6_TR3736/c0_g1_i1/m.5369